MEGEVYNFIKDWFLILVSLSYCFSIGKIISQGTKRLFCILPVIFLFLVLPSNLYSSQLTGFTAFFISWLANFKLLLYAFGDGPLSSPSISLNQFMLLTCFPIEIKQHGQKGHLKHNPIVEKGQKSLLNYAIKALLIIANILLLHEYREYMHPKFILIIYSLHTYLILEVVSVILAALARAILGLDLEPQFNDPYLSTSVQDFWSRRWNLIVPSILRPTVYNPALKICSPLITRKWAPIPAIIATFIVSGAMHEIIFYYLDLERSMPTLEITWQFLLCGVVMATEVALKKIVDRRWQLPRLISTPLTIGYVSFIAFPVLLSPALRVKTDMRTFDEYCAVITFLKNVVDSFRTNLVSFNHSI